MIQYCGFSHNSPLQCQLNSQQNHVTRIRNLYGAYVKHGQQTPSRRSEWFGIVNDN